MAFTTAAPLRPSRRTTQATTPRRTPLPRTARSRTILATATNEAETNEAETNETETNEAKSTESVELAPPPSTFYQAITQAQAAVETALKDGYTLLEVEFPPLPTSQLESAAVGAYDVFDANLRLAIDFGERFAQAGKKVVLAFPDQAEKDRAVEQNGESETPMENMRFGCLRDSRKGAFIERLWTKPDLDIAVRDEDDVFVILGASCQELPDVEGLVEAAGERPVILFNLKLDTSRGDLGLPAFPRKELHYRFLSTVLPVYYIRSRTYSRSLAKPPYIVNYSGALYRVYPGCYQVLLDTARGNYRRLASLEERPALGKVRDILTEGMNIDGLSGKRDSIVFKGYKSVTWWEEDTTKAASKNWRS